MYKTLCMHKTWHAFMVFVLWSIVSTNCPCYCLVHVWSKKISASSVMQSAIRCTEESQSSNKVIVAWF